MNKSKENKKLYIWLLCGLGSVMLILLFAIFLIIGVLIGSSNNIEYDDPVVRNTETTSKINDLYLLTCTNTDNKKYNGYAVGDVMHCVIRFNYYFKSFKDYDVPIYEMKFRINKSSSLTLQQVYRTGLGGEDTYSSLQYNVKDNVIFVKNQYKYGYNFDGEYCDIKKRNCWDGCYESLVKNADNLSSIEIHLLFRVNSKLSNNNSIKVDLSDNLTQVYHFKTYSVKGYSATLKYSYNIRDNDKYYVGNDKTIYKFIDNKYVANNKITCKEYSCEIYSDKIIESGYVVIKESPMNDSDSYYRVFDIENNKDFKTYKSLYVVKGEENVYLVGTGINDLKTYTITRLKDNKMIDSFRVSNPNDVYAVTYLHGKLVVYITDKGIKEYEVK